MRIIRVREIDSAIESVISKPNTEVKKKVLSIVNDIRKRRDKALKEYEKKFSGVSLRSFLVDSKEIKDAYLRVTKDQINAITLAKKRLEKSEIAIKNRLVKINLKIDGIKINKVFAPIDTVGCYIPGGKARYPSTVIMSVVPAKVAGVRKIIAVSPPNEKGKIDPLTLVAADICGVNRFYKIGGAQAIAALAYGTESIPQVDKIVGPGGLYVTEAKSLLSDTVSIDMIAGPTELAIIADSTANPEFIALDLISQAEHSPDTKCCLITSSQMIKNKVLKCLQDEIKVSKRSSIVQKSLQENGFIAICNTEKYMVDFANKLAPEHIEIMTENSKKIADKISTGGVTLIGENTPSSASDYLLGSNHILPTNRFGRTRGSLGVLDYIKIQTKVTSSKNALNKISKYMKAFTDAEGLPNHYEAIRRRLQ